jgi:hypothetical protein
MFKVFDLTRSGSRFRPTIYRTQGQHANYYTTDVILTWKEVVVVVLFKKRNKHTSHANCKPRNFYLMCFLCMFAYSDDQYFAVVHLFGILCCIFCFVYLRSVCCVPNVLFIFVLCVVYPMFCLSSFCVLCTQCFVYLRSVCCVPDVLFIFVLCVVYPMFCLSSFCVLCTQCCQFLLMGPSVFFNVYLLKIITW